MNFICETCGTQYGATDLPPCECMICRDDRQYVAWNGQKWTTHEELQVRFEVRVVPYRGMLSITTEPAFAIGHRALLLRTTAGNILWEALPVVTDAAISALSEAGGVSMIAISHPHFYSGMVEWSRAFDNAPIYLNDADRQWVVRSDGNIRHWGGDRLSLGGGVTLVRCGGHFDGSTVLHWENGPMNGGALFAGDTLQVAQDRRRVSFMYSYPNMIPLNRQSVEAVRDQLIGLRFADVYGYASERDIIGDARGAVDRSFDSYIRAVG